VPWNQNYFDFGTAPGIHSFSYQNLLRHGVIGIPVGAPKQFRVVTDGWTRVVLPGGQCKVSVSYQPDGAPAAGQLLLWLTDVVTHANFLSTPVQLFGNGAAFVATSQLNGVYSFPRVRVAAAGASARRIAPLSAPNSIALWLQIHGGDPVYFNPVDVASPFQVVSGCARTVEPGSQCSMTVQFAPSSPGLYQTTLQPSAINAATGAAIPAQTLTLVGTGVGSAPPADQGA
jgi:hypothetical protein